MCYCINNLEYPYNFNKKYYFGNLKLFKPELITLKIIHVYDNYYLSRIRTNELIILLVSLLSEFI